MYSSSSERATPREAATSALLRRWRPGRTLVTRLRDRLRARYRWRLVESAPRRRTTDLDDVARATVVGQVTDVVGDGPALAAWETDGDPTTPEMVVGRETRPFALEDETGSVQVRVPPDGAVVSDSDDSRQPTTTIEHGDHLSVTGRVVRHRDGGWALTGPGFVLRDW
ncbi:OB-fold nucleic acid binding domain-containing protein [Haloferax sp. S1W]|uniref:OB-fold nucleic acid binding domain-containing protein n=1 Tax=Haloferax sp. S1W TaxID=3377110 RepID=UPI0037C64F42